MYHRRRADLRILTYLAIVLDKGVNSNARSIEIGGTAMKTRSRECYDLPLGRQDIKWPLRIRKPLCLACALKHIGYHNFSAIAGEALLLHPALSQGCLSHF